MANEPLWFVRAGEGGRNASNFRSTGTVGIGWTEVGPISPDTPDEEIDARFEKTYPDDREAARATYANQVRRYLREIRVGDGVVPYDPTDRSYLLGRIETEWKEAPLPRRRAVTWTHRVDRDALTENARNKLGSIATFFRVGPEAEAELLQNAIPLFGDVAPATVPVRGQRAPALVAEDFDVLRRNRKCSLADAARGGSHGDQKRATAITAIRGEVARQIGISRPVEAPAWRSTGPNKPFLDCTD